MIRRGEREVVEALRAAGCRPAVRHFDRLTETARSAAKELGVDVERIVKSLVFSCGDKPVVALLPGNRMADMRAVARVQGAGRVRMADPDLVLKWTGFPVGAVPPLAHATAIPVLMDEEVPAIGPVYPAAGEKNNVFETTFKELLMMTGARVCKISKMIGER